MLAIADNVGYCRQCWLVAAIANNAAYWRQCWLVLHVTDNALCLAQPMLSSIGYCRQLGIADIAGYCKCNAGHCRPCWLLQAMLASSCYCKQCCLLKTLLASVACYKEWCLAQPVLSSSGYCRQLGIADSAGNCGYNAGNCGQCVLEAAIARGAG